LNFVQEQCKIRNQEIFKFRSEGSTIYELAGIYRLSYTRIKQILIEEMIKIIDMNNLQNLPKIFVCNFIERKLSSYKIIEFVKITFKDGKEPNIQIRIGTESQIAVHSGKGIGYASGYEDNKK